MKLKLFFKALLIFFSFLGIAPQGLSVGDYRDELNAGIDLGNHGSKIREYFTTARTISIDLLNGYSSNAGVSDAEKRTINFMLSELSKVRFIWQAKLPNGQCTQTTRMEGADIHFSFAICSESITSLLASAKLIIATTSLHLPPDQIPLNIKNIETHWQRTFPAVYRQLGEVFPRNQNESPNKLVQRPILPVGRYRLENDSSVIVNISSVGEVEIQGQIVNGSSRLSFKVEQLLDWNPENSMFQVNGYAFRDDQAAGIPVTVKVIPVQKNVKLEIQFSEQFRDLVFLTKSMK